MKMKKRTSFSCTPSISPLSMRDGPQRWCPHRPQVHARVGRDVQLADDGAEGRREKKTETERWNRGTSAPREGENPPTLLRLSLSLSLSSIHSHVVTPDDLEARQGDLLDAGLGMAGEKET